MKWGGIGLMAILGLVLWAGSRNGLNPTAHQHPAVSGGPDPGGKVFPGGLSPAERTWGPGHAPDYEAEAVIPGQRIVRIPSGTDLGAVLARAHKLGLRVTGLIPGLRMVRLAVEAQDEASLRRLLQDFPGLEAVSNHFVGLLPNAPSKDVSGVPVAGFGTAWIQALGVSEVDSQWGKGVTVAVLDTGIESHLVLKDRTWKTIDLLPESPAGGGHGTAVSSLMVANNAQLPGIAPATELINVRVLDAQGQGDAFTVAEGIVRAVDAGADIINLSLGSEADNVALREAVRYAVERGVAVVAAAGNDGGSGILYPANYEGVTAVGASTATKEVAPFSNRGMSLDVLAPGAGIPAAYAEKMAVSMNGTSASAAVFSGALAALISQESNLGAQAGAAALIDRADDGGNPGRDASYGNGLLDLEAAMRRNDPSFNDTMVTASYVAGSARTDGAVPWNVVVQNSGNTFMQGAQMTLTVGNQTTYAWVPALSSRQTHVAQFWVYPNNRTGTETQVNAAIQLGRTPDSRPANDRLTVVWR